MIEDKKRERAELDAMRSVEEVIRDREELAEQVKALGELKEMAASYGFDISRPAANAREAVQWLYLAYLGAVKEQNGAAMSLGRVSTFLDVYLERDLDAGVLTETDAQGRSTTSSSAASCASRAPEYDALFSGDLTVTSRWRDRRTADRS